MESIGFNWEGKESSFPKWNAQFNNLLKYEKVNGNCDVPSTYYDKPLANWVTQQRRSYKAKCDGKKSSIKDEQVEQLEDIGFQWVYNKERTSITKWNAQFEELLSYESDNGNCDVPSTYKDKTLAMWVAQQRRSYRAKLNGKKSPINDEQIEHLEDLGFHWG